MLRFPHPLPIPSPTQSLMLPPIAVSSAPDEGASDSDANENDVGTIGEQGSNTLKQRGSNWSDEEDLKLVNAWCTVSTDPAKGAEHREQGLWELILDAFESTGNPSKRDGKALKDRWAIISKTCSVFSAAFGMAQDKRKSGESDDDVVSCYMFMIKTYS